VEKATAPDKLVRGEETKATKPSVKTGTIGERVKKRGHPKTPRWQKNPATRQLAKKTPRYSRYSKIENAEKATRDVAPQKP